MRVRATGGPPATVDADVLAVPIYREDAEMTGDLAELDAASGGAIRQAIDWGEFNPLEHPLALIGGGDLTARWLLLLNAGSRGRGAWRARRLASVEGIFAGISSGGACDVAMRIARQVENATIVFIICDRGDRYLSTGVFPA